MPEITISGVSDIAPSRMKEFTVKELELLVVNLNGSFYVLRNICTHRGCKLSNGTLTGEIVRCPCHGSEFNVRSGIVVKGPALEAVVSYPAIVGNGNISVTI
jgi:nitrite reductase/ring-hydroxylating ferredoxin subunit